MKLWNIKDDNIPLGAVYIGRNSIYGNPYSHLDLPHTIKCKSRAEACDKFEQEILPTLDIEPLRGKDLVCHCVPLRCHGQSIINKLQQNDLSDFFI